MSDLVDPAKIEAIVGASRHPHLHLGRAVSSERTVYILHSEACINSGRDLRDCSWSWALDAGIDAEDWDGWEDRAVVLAKKRDGNGWLLVPSSPAGGEGQ